MTCKTHDWYEISASSGRYFGLYDNIDEWHLLRGGGSRIFIKGRGTRMEVQCPQFNDQKFGF